MSASVAICLPSTGTHPVMFTYDLGRMMTHTYVTRPEVALRPAVLVGSSIGKQRDELAQAALELPDVTHVLFLDTDMRFPPDTLLRMLDRDVPFLAANYPERQPPYRPVAFRDVGRSDERVYTEADSAGLETVSAVGFGVALLTRALLEAIPRPRFATGFTSVGGQFAGHLGEDIFLCRKAADVGMPPQIDHDLSKDVRHIATIELGVADACALRPESPA